MSSRCFHEISVNVESIDGPQTRCCIALDTREEGLWYAMRSRETAWFRIGIGTDSVDILDGSEHGAVSVYGAAIASLLVLDE